MPNASSHSGSAPLWLTPIGPDVSRATGPPHALLNQFRAQPRRTHVSDEPIKCQSNEDPLPDQRRQPLSRESAHRVLPPSPPTPNRAPTATPVPPPDQTTLPHAAPPLPTVTPQPRRGAPGHRAPAHRPTHLPPPRRPLARQNQPPHPIRKNFSPGSNHLAAPRPASRPRHAKLKTP